MSMSLAAISRSPRPALQGVRRTLATALMTEPTYPIGDAVELRMPRPRPSGDPLLGKFVRLDRPNAQRDAPPLFAATHNGEIDDRQWAYLPYGPFENERAMGDWIERAADSSDPLFFVVCDSQSRRPQGMVSYLNIAPEHGTLEIGHVWYVPKAQRSAVNTETVYLLLKECFDELRYRRAEWKCDALNERSISAALRLGFSFEGIFRQHYVTKGRNRDTAWFSMLDHEWPARRANFEAVLYDPDCRSSLTSLNARKSPWSRPGV